MIALFLAVNKDTLKKVNSYGELPIYDPAYYKTLAAVDYLLKIYPELALTATPNSHNILHASMDDK